jgi:hypothetical protein
MSVVAQFLILAAIDVAGLFAIWFILRARVGRYLELESLLSGVREEARALITEMNETADRNVSLVEDRMKSLGELLDEADRRMGLVRRELGARSAEREVYARLSKRRPIVPSEESAQAPTAPRAARAPSAAAEEGAVIPAAGEDAADAGGEGGGFRAAGGEGGPVEFLLASARAVPGGGLPDVRVSEERIETGRTLRERAIELHRKGFSAQIIAAKVGATVAEIELMIEMEEMRPAES